MATGKNWPQWIHGFITPEEGERISAAVAQIETRTSGEVVPMIVRRSSAIGHVPWLLTLILLVIILVFEVPHWDFFAEMNATWLLFLLSALCFLISIPLSRWKWVQRLLVPRADQSFQVEERALIEFYASGVTGTKAKTGILIFISLMERKAVILADQAISDRLPKETWAQICQSMVELIRQDKTAEALLHAIERSGELLAEHFPHGPGENINELSNLLILKE